ncbi:MAG: DUF192 domain-containing protein [Desulfuromonas thiophila]|nr:DUF192 domain-containing protein [Desulfuromonas thiophila]
MTASNGDMPLPKIGLILLFLVGAGAMLTAPQHVSIAETRSAQVCDLYIDSAVIKSVPVADTERRRNRGLSGREDAGPGMWFEFDADSRPSFWMKDTKMALSVAFISAEGHITEILDMEPGSLTKVRPQQPVRYALEVSQGNFGALGINVGNTVNFRACSVVEDSGDE